MKDLIKYSRKFAYDEVKRTGMPLKLHIDLSCVKAKELAMDLGANEDIVEVGTLLMDCIIGTAIQEGKLKEHVQMCLEKTNEILENYEISESDKENIRHCVLEHHGVENFFSLESEICCNADCYRFASTEGFFYTVRFLREMPVEDFKQLLRNKFDEKKEALSLDSCKKELENQLITLDDFITQIS